MTPAVVLGSALVGAACGAPLRAAVFRHATAPGESAGRCPRCAEPVPPARRSLPAARLPLPRCPGCRGRLGPRTGSMALAAAAVCLALAVRVDSVPLLASLCWFAVPAVALAAVDVSVRRLPDALTVPAGAGLLAGMAVTAAVDHRPEALLRAVLAGLALFAGYLVLALASPGSLGFGDCKLAAWLGAALGWFGWSAVLAGTLVAWVLAAAGGLVLVAGRRAGRGDAIPFGPFMLVGALAAVLTG